MRVAIAALTVSLALPALAQTPPGKQPPPDAPPPPVIEGDPSEAPQVTIVKRGEDTVEEFRIRGRLFMVKVTPPHGTPYYLVDRKGDGVLMRTESLEPGTSVPMWVLKRW